MSRTTLIVLGGIVGISAIVQTVTVLVAATGAPTPNSDELAVPVCRALGAAIVSAGMLWAAYRTTSRTASPAPRSDGTPWGQGHGPRPWEKGRTRPSDEE